jgi:multidrug resistance efflux pump
MRPQDSPKTEKDTAEGQRPTANGNGGSRKQRIAALRQSPRVRVVAVLLLLSALAGVILYVQAISGRIYIEKAEVSAPIISLSPPASGVLEKVLVKEGDRIHRNNVVAKVSGVEIRAKTDGIVVGTQDVVGQTVGPQTAVVQMIDPREFRLVGHLEEDKGLADIKPGQRVVFTVDAFGSSEFLAVVDSVSPTSRQSDIVFSISDKRQVKEFDVKAVFDTNAYPEIKNGMSAKMWVYK